MNSIDHIRLYSITCAKPQTEKSHLGRKKRERLDSSIIQPNTKRVNQRQISVMGLLSATFLKTCRMEISDPVCCTELDETDRRCWKGKRCYLTASLFILPREYVKQLATNCFSLPLLHRKEQSDTPGLTLGGCKLPQNQSLSYQVYLFLCCQP